MKKKVYWSLCEILLSNFKDVSILSTHFSKKKASKKQISRENPSSGSQVVPRIRTDRHADMTKLIVVFRNFYELA